MITGVVNAGREPIIQIIVRDAKGQEHQQEAVVEGRIVAGHRFHITLRFKGFGLFGHRFIDADHQVITVMVNIAVPVCIMADIFLPADQ